MTCRDSIKNVKIKASGGKSSTLALLISFYSIFFSFIITKMLLSFSKILENGLFLKQNVSYLKHWQHNSHLVEKIHWIHQHCLVQPSLSSLERCIWLVHVKDLHKTTQDVLLVDYNEEVYHCFLQRKKKNMRNSYLITWK